MNYKTVGIALVTMLAMFSPMGAQAALDVTAATTYLSGDVTTQIENVGVAIFTLAALAMGIAWIKATFF